MAEYVERGEVLALFDEQKWQRQVCIDAVKELPAADVAPVVHGWWVPKDYMFPYSECSVCKSEVQTDDYGDASPYCPWCGAKMDKEDADGLDTH